MTRRDPAARRRLRPTLLGIGGGGLAAALLAGGVLAAGAAGAGVPNAGLGTPHAGDRPTFVAYYDGHRDAYVSTDVSSRAQAKALGINFAATLTGAKGASPMYLVRGRAAHGQVAVFGSEPGERDYSPLWREIDVRWAAGHAPALLVRDDQITALARKHALTMTMTPIVLNGPVVTVGRSG